MSGNDSGVPPVRSEEEGLTTPPLTSCGYCGTELVVDPVYEQECWRCGRTQEKHRHHWYIEEANGPTSVGHCFGCGLSRIFRNFQEHDFLVRSEYMYG